MKQFFADISKYRLQEDNNYLENAILSLRKKKKKTN